MAGPHSALSDAQQDFAARMGATTSLESTVSGRVFVYVEEADRTTRYEVGHDGSPLRRDVFARELAA